MLAGRVEQTCLAVKNQFGKSRPAAGARFSRPCDTHAPPRAAQDGPIEFRGSFCKYLRRRPPRARPLAQRSRAQLPGPRVGREPGAYLFNNGQHPLPRTAQTPASALASAFSVLILPRAPGSLEPDLEPIAGGVVARILAALARSGRGAGAAPASGRRGFSSGCGFSSAASGWSPGGRCGPGRDGGSTGRPGERAHPGLR